ncbi:assimilatory sulfite reductase (NADPH) flavoprotein subunit [Pelistega ratti]|uniref:assimilatory sulfite reductase (NADPH) flavoprotein subunit n=1 Tax=Pelistega ratti TaxID=2652177 RepID=UPI0013571A50|nr:assimilatory sulfite reductase (NADPH) flavoprotein subunit [Pelistega ratti]
MNDIPVNKEICQAIEQLNPLQLAWISGYCWAKAQGVNPAVAIGDLQSVSTLATTVSPLKVTVLSLSQTGNAKGVATRLAERLQQENIEVSCISAKDYKAKNIVNEELLLLVSSTQGEGEPPEEGVVLYKLLYGKKAPSLSTLRFAVLGLGDSSYPKFCQAGKDFDQRLGELGATRLLDCTTADLDYQATAEKWIEQISTIVKQQVQERQSANVVSQTRENTTTVSSVYTKQNPFPATVLTHQKITARQAEKDVRHIELDLSDSGLHYQAGDALGVWFDNDPALVQEILRLVSLQGDEIVEIENKSIDLYTALTSYLEISQNTSAFVQSYAVLANHQALRDLLQSPETLNEYIANTPLVGVIKAYPSHLTAVQLVDLLRPLTPRLYSISSSPAEVGEEVHITVGVVRFDHQGTAYTGAASGFLADRIQEDSTVRVFIEPNDHFRLPEDTSKPIIMIGSGTGIAPFRAFLQQRAANEASGKNWLIFGNQRFTQDFLYQLEWQQLAKEGYLHKYDFAWSRDQEEKIYVQDKIRAAAKEVWQWLQEGAYIYVCGDASRMARDVEKALLTVIEQEGQLSTEEAEEYLMELREDKRYQRDVY